MKQLTREEILSIPELVKSGLRIKEVAERLGVHERTINKQINKLREAGIEVPTKVGRRPIDLNDTSIHH